MNINTLIDRDPIDCEAIAAALDAMTHQQRVEATRSISRRGQSRLFHAVEGFRPLAVDDFVAPHASLDQTVAHEGVNNLPMFRRFAKVMYRQPDGVVAGRNVQTMAWFTGHGYFIVRSGDRGGEVVIDYNQLPTTTPSAWPKVRSNDWMFSYFVYRQLQDVMRGVSRHVTIGRAKRADKWLPNYFILVKPEETISLQQQVA